MFLVSFKKPRKSGDHFPWWAPQRVMAAEGWRPSGIKKKPLNVIDLAASSWLEQEHTVRTKMTGGKLMGRKRWENIHSGKFNDGKSQNFHGRRLQFCRLVRKISQQKASQSFKKWWKNHYYLPQSSGCHFWYIYLHFGIFHKRLTLKLTRSYSICLCFEFNTPENGSSKKVWKG